MANRKGASESAKYVVDKVKVATNKDLRNLDKNVRMKDGKIKVATGMKGDRQKTVDQQAAIHAENARKARQKIRESGKPPEIKSHRMAERLGISRNRQK